MISGAFYHLSPAKREQLRQLDRALHEEDSASQSRLWEALDRFNVWLEHLPDEDRRRITEAPSRDDRLRVIKELREQEFIRRPPQKVRESLEQLAPERRGLALTLLRKQEQQIALSGNRATCRGSIGPCGRPIFLLDSGTVPERCGSRCSVRTTRRSWTERKANGLIMS